MSVICIDGSGTSKADYSGIAVVTEKTFVAVRLKKQGCNSAEMAAFNMAVRIHECGKPLTIITDSKHVIAHHDTWHQVHWFKRCSSRQMILADLLSKFICHAGGFKLSGFWVPEDIPRYEQAVIHFRRKLNDPVRTGVSRTQQR